MVIRADKLFRLILKTDLNKHKIEWYRRKLGINQQVDITTNTIKSDAKARMVSRGPFVAIFKHESIAFVNSLENAARSIHNRNKKKRKKSSIGCAFGELSTLRLSVKTEPLRHGTLEAGKTIIGEDDDIVESHSPKRKKIEDITGLIIVAAIDHDEMSAVSVSPTSDSSVVPTTASKAPLNRIDGNYTFSHRKKKQSRKDRSRSSRKSARKEKKRHGGSLRSINSIGKSSRGDSEDLDSCDSPCSSSSSSSRRSLFSGSSSGLTVQTSSSTETETQHQHERSNSNYDATVDIREVMQENNNHNGTALSFYPGPGFANATANENANVNVNVNANTMDMRAPYFNPAASSHGMVMSAHQGHPFNNMAAPSAHMIYSYPPPAHLNAMHWQQQQQQQQQQHQQAYQYPSHYHTSADNIEYEECFLIKGVTSFIRMIFGLDKKQELFEASPARNLIPRYSPHEPHHFQPNPHPIPSNHHFYQQQYEEASQQPRPRTRSRVFDSNNEHLAHLTLDHDVSDSSDVSSMYSEVMQKNHAEQVQMDDDSGIERVLSFKLNKEGAEKPECNRRRNSSCPEAVMADWKSRGQLANDGSGLAGLYANSDSSLDVTSQKGQEQRNTEQEETRSSKKPSAKKESDMVQEVTKKPSRPLMQRSNTTNNEQISDMQRKKLLLSRPRPTKIAGASRSKTDSTSLPRPSLTRPSLSKSSSVGSASVQNRERSNSSYHHYR